MNSKEEEMLESITAELIAMIRIRYPLMNFGNQYKVPIEQLSYEDKYLLRTCGGAIQMIAEGKI
ncbi:hypothetical protein [Phascolarctobacterium sp.]|uniref:hypothetical protein n=1 Tax=Phascolarctobacterium sp. TaxID=2049039 RepID=UPI003865E927